MMSMNEVNDSIVRRAPASILRPQTVVTLSTDTEGPRNSILTSTDNHTLAGKTIPLSGRTIAGPPEAGGVRDRPASCFLVGGFMLELCSFAADPDERLCLVDGGDVLIDSSHGDVRIGAIKDNRKALDGTVLQSRSAG